MLFALAKFASKICYNERVNLNLEPNSMIGNNCASVEVFVGFRSNFRVRHLLSHQLLDREYCQLRYLVHTQYARLITAEHK